MSRKARLARLTLRDLPLPEPHLALLGAGMTLQALRPLPLPGAGLRLAALGADATMAVAAAAIGWAARSARGVDLTEPDRLVTGGPYALTRHPMYEAWTALYAGVAVRRRNGWLGVLFPVLLVLVHRETGHEDRRLRERFGEAHAAYANGVPRYLTIHLARILRGPAS